MERTTRRTIAEIAALAAAYALVGRVGLSFEPVAGFATLVWPPSGLALVALVRGGTRLWPGVALGALAVNVWAGAHPAIAAGIAIGNTLEAVIAAELLRRGGFDAALERVRDVALLAVAGAGLSTIAAASIGVASLAAGGVITAADAPLAWRAWWLGDAMGDLVVAPWLACWIRRPPPLARARWLEAVALAIAAAGCGAAVFRGDEDAGTMYLLFPPLVWSAVRFGQRGATATVLLVSAIAIAGTATDRGPFVRGALPHALLELQTFMAVVAIVVLLLAAAIAERDRALSLAESAVRARDDFLSIASHELRSPLSALTLQIGTLRNKATDDAKALERAARQTDRLEVLIGNLLDVSRSETGQLAIRPERIDLAPLLRDLVDRAREQAEKAGCELTSTLPDRAEGRWDWLRLEQVVGNLLANAFRHASRAPVEVALVGEADHVTLSVRDHGPGIPPDQLEAIFDRYHRGGARREQGGLGLGLYIARRLVEAHGGTISAESSPAGSRFVVRLPRELPREKA